MDFELSNDQRELLDQVDRYLRDTMAVDRLHKAFDGDTKIFESMWRGLFDLGLGGVLIPEAYGGLGLGLLETSSISERLGFAAAPGAWIGHALASYAISSAGSDAQKGRWLPRMVSGDVVGTVALMEREEWSPDRWQLAGELRISGEKHYILGVEHANIVLVGLAGGILGLVEMTAPGVSMGVWSSTDRTRPVGHLGLENAAVELLPRPFGEQLLNAGLVLTAADAHGGSLRVRDDIVEYSKVRKQFDRPIAAFQAVKHKLADLALSVEYGGALYREAAATCDRAPQDASIAASTAKAHVTDAFNSSARIATESYGGIGYTWEHSAHIWLRRAMFDFAWLGSPTAHRKRAVDLLGW